MRAFLRKGKRKIEERNLSFERKFRHLGSRDVFSRIDQREERREIKKKKKNIQPSADVPPFN